MEHWGCSEGLELHTDCGWDHRSRPEEMILCKDKSVPLHGIEPHNSK